MAISALKIGAASFALRRNVPAPTPFVGNEGKIDPRPSPCYKFSISIDGYETVVRGVGGFVESGESVGE